MTEMAETIAAVMTEGRVSALEDAGSGRTYFRAADLMAMEFPEPRWAVPGLIPEGVSVLAGAPKFGKSWLCLGVGVAVALGGKALGKIDTKQGSVLYAALEDTPASLRERLALVLGDEPLPEALHFTTALPRLPDLIDMLDDWLTVHEDARLVIVDVFRKVRPIGDGRGGASIYNEDYDALAALGAIARRHNVAILVVHHTRKSSDEEDPFNEVSGSTGLTGAADALLLVKRARNTSEGALHVTGRSMREHRYGLAWDVDTFQWRISEHPAEAVDMGVTRRAILAHLTASPGETPQRIAEQTGRNLNTVKSNVRRMVEDGQLDTDGEGRYFPPAGATPATAATGVQGLRELHTPGGAVASDTDHPEEQS